MTDVLPVVLIGADEDLAVELVGGHGERRHVRRKLKKRGEAVHTNETQSGRERFGSSVFVHAGQDEAPFAEGGDVNVVGISLQAGLLQRLRDAPERIAGEHRRGALNHYESLGAEVARNGAVEGGSVELAERIVRGIRKIDDDEIETVGVRIHPRKSIGVNDVHARGEKRFAIEPGEHGVRGKNPGHLGIEVDEGDALDLRILQNFANSEAVATAKNQDAARGRNGGQAGMDERFVIAVFVAGAKLQVAVEKKTEVVLEAREDKVLIAGVEGKDNFVGVDVVFAGGGDAPRVRHPRAPCAPDDDARNAQTARGGKLVGEKKRAP